MTKVIGPLFSLDARGTIAHTITYGANQFGNWVRRIVKRGYTRNAAQDLVRTWFKLGLDTWKSMSSEEKQLWTLALTNYEKYGSSMSKNFHRMGRCLFLHHVLTDLSFIWEGSHAPPELKKIATENIIVGYNQLCSDLETLTGLVFCIPVKVVFLKYLGEVISEGNPSKGAILAGQASGDGTELYFNEGLYNKGTYSSKRFIVAHELTHAIMSQHGWDYGGSVAVSEQIASECGGRVADGDLTPVYLYEGKALPELVDNPGCS